MSHLWSSDENCRSNLVKTHQLRFTFKRTFDRFCAIDAVDDREHPGRPSKITEQKIDEIRDVIQDEPQSSVRAVATNSQEI